MGLRRSSTVAATTSTASTGGGGVSGVKPVAAGGATTGGVSGVLNSLLRPRLRDAARGEGSRDGICFAGTANLADIVYVDVRFDEFAERHNNLCPLKTFE